MMTSDFGDLATTFAHSAPDGELHADRLLTDPAGRRLAKRDRAATLREMRAAGVSPAEARARAGEAILRPIIFGTGREGR